MLGFMLFNPSAYDLQNSPGSPEVPAGSRPPAPAPLPHRGDRRRALTQRGPRLLSRGPVTESPMPLPDLYVVDGGNAYWHTTSDTPDHCSAESLGAVGNVLLRVLYVTSSTY